MSEALPRRPRSVKPADPVDQQEVAWSDPLFRVVAGFAHEVRNPLSAIQGLVDLLADAPDVPPDGEILTRLRSQVNRLDTLVRSLVRLDPPHPPVFATHTVGEILGRTRVRLEKAGLALPDGIDAWTGRERPTLRTDLEQAATILEELVRNALDALGDSGRPLLLVTPLVEDGFVQAGVRFEVIDHGPGIAPRIQKLIFEPFFSTRRGRAGLGLALARSAAGRLGAELSVRSAPGEETAFVLLLPVGVR